MYRLFWGPNRQTVRGAHSLGADGAAFSHDECKKAPSLAAVGQRMRATLWGAPRCFFGSCGPSVRSPVPPRVGSPFSVAPPPRCPIAHVSDFLSCVTLSTRLDREHHWGSGRTRGTCSKGFCQLRVTAPYREVPSTFHPLASSSDVVGQYHSRYHAQARPVSRQSCTWACVCAVPRGF